MKFLATSVDFRFASRKPLLSLAFTIGMLLLMFALPGKVLADQPDISIDIIPSTTSFPPDEQVNTGGKPVKVEVEIEVSNLTASVLQNLTLCWYTNVNVDVNGFSSGNCLQTLNTLSSGGQYVWVVDLTRIGALTQPDTVQFRVEYTRPAAGQNGGVQRDAFSALTVQSLQPQTAQQVADISVLTSLSTLNDQQSGQVFLLVTNKSDFQLTITDLKSKGPVFITFVPEDFTTDGEPKAALTLAPHQQRTFAIDVATNGPVPTGKQILVFEVGVSWMESGQAQTGNLVASQQVDVGAFGSSEIVTLLGIPSFLVLPGFLIVTTALLLIKWFNAQISDKIQVGLASPEFWMAAITLSMIVDVIYFAFTQHKFWVQYDLLDVVIIWVSSIIAAVLLYFLVFGAINLGIRVRSWWMQRFVPAETDSPTTVLRKLQNQGLDLVCKYVPLKVGGEVKRVFLLEREEKGKPDYWVSPAIVVRWKDGQVQSSLQHELNNCLKSKSAGSLADLLDKEAAWDVSWRRLRKQASQEILIGRPYKAGEGDFLDTFSNQQFIIEQEFYTDDEPV